MCGILPCVRDCRRYNKIMQDFDLSVCTRHLEKFYLYPQYVRTIRRYTYILYLFTYIDRCTLRFKRALSLLNILINCKKLLRKFHLPLDNPHFIKLKGVLVTNSIYLEMQSEWYLRTASLYKKNTIKISTFNPLYDRRTCQHAIRIIQIIYAQSKQTTIFYL